MFNTALITAAILTAIAADRNERVDDTCTCDSCTEGRKGWDKGIERVNALITEVGVMSVDAALSEMDGLMSDTVLTDRHCSYNVNYADAIIHFLNAGYMAAPDRNELNDMSDGDVDPWIGDLNSLWGME